jgi:hypothetical protein
VADKVSIEECRRILGSSAESLTDAEVETMRDDLERTADVLYMQMTEAGRAGLEAQRWQVENTSLDGQEKVCREWCRTNGLEVSRVYVERGESAKTANPNPISGDVSLSGPSNQRKHQPRHCLQVRQIQS